MKSLKQHWDSQAGEYDSFSRQLIPRYEELQKTLIEALPMDRKRPIRVLDMGCGTGITSLTLKQYFPAADVTCLDLTEKMLSIARSRLVEFGDDVSYVCADFSESQLPGQYDAIISAMAMHHIRDHKTKQEMYQRINKALHSGGVFVNGDTYLPATRHGQETAINGWMDYIGNAYPSEEQKNYWLQRHYETDDPARLADELGWLKEAGFAAVDVVWRYQNLAVVAAQKAPILLSQINHERNQSK